MYLNKKLSRRYFILIEFMHGYLCLYRLIFGVWVVFALKWELVTMHLRQKTFSKSESWLKMSRYGLFIFQYPPNIETSDKHILTKLMFWKETPIHWQTKIMFWQWILVILAYKNSVITINTCYYENWNWMWRKNIFDIYVTEYGTALTTILPILFLYLNTVIVTAGTFEP